MNLAELAAQVLSIATILAQLGILALVLMLVRYWRTPARSSLLVTVSRRAFWYVFIIALTSTAGSLFYSEIIGFVPCELCWYQRILMYPQLVIFGIAAWKKDKLAVWYGTVLSVIGAFIAGSQYYLQMSGHSLIPCSAEPETAICAQRLVFEFGYITLPLMSLTAFVMIILLLITRAKVDKTS